MDNGTITRADLHHDVLGRLLLKYADFDVGVRIQGRSGLEK